MSDWIDGWGQTWSSDYDLNIEINGFRYQWPSVALNKQMNTLAGRRLLGEATNLLRQVKSQMKFGMLGQYQMTRRFDDGTAIFARSVFGQDFISIKTGGGKVREEELQTFISMPCVAQWSYYEQKIFFRTENEKFNFYTDLSIFGESIEGVKCITPLADHNLAVGGFVYKPEGSDTMKVIRYLIKDAGGPNVIYNGQTYQKRSFTYSSTPIPWKPAQGTVPIREYPYRSVNGQYSILGYRVERNGGRTSMYPEETTPCFMALWMETPTPKDPLGGIKFQVICFIPIDHILTVDGGSGPFDVHLSHHWQWVYHDGTEWKQVPDKNEEDNFELVLTGPYSGGTHPYQYPACFDRPPVILRDQDWDWESATRHEFYNTNWTCYPVYRKDLRGLAGYLKIYHTHLGDHSDAAGIQVKDRSRSVLALIGDPNHKDAEGKPAPIPPSYQKAITYDREYARVLSFNDPTWPHTMFQIIWKRGSHYIWNNTIYAPLYPVDINPLGGGCGFYSDLPGATPESRVNGYDSNVGIVMDSVLGGGSWRIVF